MYGFFESRHLRLLEKAIFDKKSAFLAENPDFRASWPLDSPFVHHFCAFHYLVKLKASSTAAQKELRLQTSGVASPFLFREP